MRLRGGGGNTGPIEERGGAQGKHRYVMKSIFEKGGKGGIGKSDKRTCGENQK